LFVGIARLVQNLHGSRRLSIFGNGISLGLSASCCEQAASVFCAIRKSSFDVQNSTFCTARLAKAPVNAERDDYLAVQNGLNLGQFTTQT